MKGLQLTGIFAPAWARMIGASVHPETRRLEIAASLVLAGGHVLRCDLSVFVRKRAQIPRCPPSSHYSRGSRTVFASPRPDSRLIDLSTISPGLSGGNALSVNVFQAQSDNRRRLASDNRRPSNLMISHVGATTSIRDTSGEAPAEPTYSNCCRCSKPSYLTASYPKAPLSDPDDPTAPRLVFAALASTGAWPGLAFRLRYPAI